MNTRAIKAVFFSVIMICCAMLFSACGATVDTALTADSSFSGKRVITATLSNSDLSEYVPGGAESIEATVKKYIPKEFTYKTSSTADDLIYTFTYEFNGIDDYRTGISNILKADPNNEVEPEISYVHEESPFNQTAYFEENFTSLDLLGWLVNGLAKDETVSGTDQSNWFETGSSKINFNGTEYSSYNQLYMNDSNSNCASNVDVTTEFLSDSTYDRKIVFTFYADTIDRINESGFNADEYFNSLASDVTSVVKSEEDNKVIYTASMSGVTADVIVSETSNILCCEAEFGVAVTPDSNGGRSIKIEVTESMDSNYYTKADSYSALSSNWYLFDGAECTDSGAASLYYNYDSESERTYYTYYPNYIMNGEKAVCSFDWDVNFDNLKVILDFAGSKVKLKLEMSVPENMLDAAKEVLYSSLSDAAPEKTTLKDSNEDGLTVYTLDLGTASAEDAASRYKTFVYNYTGERTDCSFNVEDGLSGSPFSKIKIYSAKIEIYPLTDDDAEFDFVQSGISSLTILENSNIEPLDEQPDGAYAGIVNDTIKFGAVEKSIDLFGILGVVVLAVTSIAFIIVVLVNIKGWIAAASGSKTASKAAAAVTGMASAAAATASSYIEQVSASVETTHNDTENDDDEEDFI